MPIEVPQPKYVVVVNAIQRRIDEGSYPPGSAIPSEAQIMAEFDVSRPTAVRALNLLQQEGWIDAEQGKGRYVRSRASIASRQTPSEATALLRREETPGVKLLRVGPTLANDRVAGALEVDPGTPLISRQRLVTSEIGPIELGTIYVPVELAANTGAGDAEPIAEGLMRRIEQIRGIEFDHAVQRISARLPKKDEAAALEIKSNDPVLTILLTAYDRSGKPLLAVDVLIPASRHELEDAFPLR
jgi:GntR family transcriptional regulator